jgi:hypothetical protein
LRRGRAVVPRAFTWVHAVGTAFATAAFPTSAFATAAFTASAFTAMLEPHQNANLFLCIFPRIVRAKNNKKHVSALPK